MQFHTEPDGRIRVESYRCGLLRDVTVGHLKMGGEDEDYWHFYPSNECVLNAGACNRISKKLVELNWAIR